MIFPSSVRYNYKQVILMKKLVFFFLFISLRGLGQGLIFDPESYNKIPMLNLADNAVAGTKSMQSGAKEKKDLTPYMPYIIEQEGNTCVSVSTLYYAAGVRTAFLRDVTVKRDITDNLSLAPLYNLKKMNLPCSEMVALDSILKNLISSGGVKYNVFPYTSCNYNIPDVDFVIKAKAEQKLCGEFKDANGNTINIFCNDHPVIYNIKLAITNGFPVVAGIRYDELRSYNYHKQRLYTPKIRLSDNDNKGHAVTIIGYDGDIFKIANSWGSRWGNEGYFYINAKDLQKILMGAIIFDMDLSGQASLPVNENTKGLGASFGFIDTREVAQNINYLGNGLYAATKNYQIGDQFYGVLKNLNSGMYLTIISQDASDFKVAKHYPREVPGFGELKFGSEVEDLLIAKDSPIIFPHPDYPLTITDGVKDHLIILASKKDISAELPYIINNLQNSPFRDAPIYQRLNAALNGRMISPKDITYSNTEIKGILNNLHTEEDILPLILEINHQ